MKPIKLATLLKEYAYATDGSGKTLFKGDIIKVTIAPGKEKSYKISDIAHGGITYYDMTTKERFTVSYTEWPKFKKKKSVRRVGM